MSQSASASTPDWVEANTLEKERDNPHQPLTVGGICEVIAYMLTEAYKAKNKLTPLAIGSSTIHVFGTPADDVMRYIFEKTGGKLTIEIKEVPEGMIEEMQAPATTPWTGET